MLLGVLSDTHGNLDNTSRAVELLQSQGIEVLLHCGDIGTSSVVAEFAMDVTGWPTHFVFGNVDRDEALLRHAIQDAGQTCHHRYGEIELAGRQIALLHSDDQRLFRTTIESSRFDLVCYGHTHQAESHLAGPTLVLNPGALHRANPHTVATVDLQAMTVEHFPL